MADKSRNRTEQQDQQNLNPRDRQQQPSRSGEQNLQHEELGSQQQTGSQQQGSERGQGSELGQSQQRGASSPDRNRSSSQPE